ncbi:hypothetical protein F5H01DRAFT_349336 [Linnemannia elongata]|nr:hypothetical protein F5H01DRAFT_349336 [Linnemannia elongata]
MFSLILFILSSFLVLFVLFSLSSSSFRRLFSMFSFLPLHFLFPLPKISFKGQGKKVIVTNKPSCSTMNSRHNQEHPICLRN